ncbi:hypothetical protein HYC85_004467 [Camellia sinensis]|uniref:Uncharacterized protein n=1 Tax=Camellia sinensis TaxID=4442 RepID=A0A7J7HWM3_CAMSI|nr:hypothetical protein HYC85_004467 [Camellia sinensis]
MDLQFTMPLGLMLTNLGPTEVGFKTKAAIPTIPATSLPELTQVAPRVEVTTVSAFTSLASVTRTSTRPSTNQSKHLKSDFYACV